MDEAKPLMKCGHAANAKTDDGEWICALCVGDSRATEKLPPEWMPDLDGREAVCLVCGENQPSSLDLRLYQYRPHANRDTFVCEHHSEVKDEGD